MIWRKKSYMNFSSLSEKFNLSHRKIFHQINYLVISLVNALLSRNFCQKRTRINFRNTVCVRKSTIKRDHTQKFPWNQVFSKFFGKRWFDGKNVAFSVKTVIDRWSCFWRLFHKNSWKQFIAEFSAKAIDFTNFL